MTLQLEEDVTWSDTARPSSPTTTGETWSLTGSVSIVSKPDSSEWRYPPFLIVHFPRPKSLLWDINDTSIGRRTIFTQDPSTNATVRPSNSIGELRDLSGLTADQLGRLFGVSRRSINHWLRGEAMSPTHQERLSQLLAFVRRLEGTPQERKRQLLDSSQGQSPFHQLLAQVTSPARLQVSPIAGSDRF